MPGFDELCRRLRFLFRRRQFECDLEEEMRFHLEMKARESGSMAAARRQFGNATLLREDSRSAWGWTWLEAWIADFKYAARSLAKNPGFAAVAVLTMALGIGANASIFSLVHAVLLRPLPFPEPGRLVRAGRFGAGNYGVSMPELAFWKENSRTLASVAGYRGASPQGLQFAEATDTIRTLPVTSDFLRTLAVPPALGREFRPEEMRPNGPRTIILSDALWRRRFGADRSVAGHSVVLDGTHYTVAGVLPPGFWFPGEADALVPIRVTGSLQDQGINTDMIARLRPGISLAKAQAEMATLSGNYRRLHPVQELNALTVDPFQDSLVGGIRSSLWLLFGATGLLLLIACTNLAGLLLARLAFRQKEIAMRMALGSGTGRLLRQFVAENLLLTTLGGVASLLAAYGLLGGFVALVPFYLPVSGRLAVDLPVLGFTLAVVAATSLVFSFVPFVNAANLNVNETLKASGRAAMGSGRTRTRDLLVVGETALSVSLLLAAALLIQSVYRLHQVRLGFDPHGVTTFFTPVTPQQQRHPAELRALQAELLDRLRATPGVRFAAAVNRLPLTGQGNLPAQPQGHPEQSIGPMEVRHVTPGYFQTMRIPIVRGRAFDARDNQNAPPAILIGESVARSWWGQQNPLGERVLVGSFRGKDYLGGLEPPREIVGVVADTKTIELKAPPRPTVYLPLAQTPWYDGGLNWVVRGDISPETLRRTVAAVSAGQRVDRIRAMDKIVASSITDSRFYAWVFGAFAALALVLTAVGVYGLLAFSVARRTNEIGTRMALGAGRGNVLGMVMRQGVALISAGLLIGIAGALALTRSLAKLLYGVRPADPASFVAAAITLLAVGLLASYLPALRATRVDPLEALRHE